MNSSTAKIPEPPHHFSALAKKEFRRVAATLAQRSNLDPVRLAALEVYAIAFAYCREAEQRLLVSTTVEQRRKARLDLSKASRQMRIAGRELALGSQIQVQQSQGLQRETPDDANVLAQLKDELNGVLPD